MKILALAAMLLSLNAYATGGFTCSGVKADGKKIDVYGTTGRVPGNPLVSDITVIEGEEELTMVIPRDQVVGFWNVGKRLMLAAVDANAEKMILKIKAKRDKETDEVKGKLTLESGEKVLVNCEME